MGDILQTGGARRVGGAILALAAGLAAALAALGPTLQARAAETAEAPRYGPAPAWVARAKVGAGDGSGDDKPVRVLLSDSQAHFGADADETYTETVVRAQTPDGLQGIGSISETWDP
jgi:hypothetical protein